VAESRRSLRQLGKRRSHLADECSHEPSGLKPATAIMTRERRHTASPYGPRPITGCASTATIAFPDREERAAAEFVACVEQVCALVNSRGVLFEATEAGSWIRGDAGTSG
jgi:hypothetical protein